MTYELIVTEKPSAAKKIAELLADKRPKKVLLNNITYFEITHNKKKIIVCSAVGHLYTLAEKGKKSWTYPVYDIEWQPIHIARKAIEHTDNYIKTIKHLCKKAKKIIVATDYDVEGEVIGLNVVRYACNKKDAYRMKFSTLTKDELNESYKKAKSHLDWGQAQAGETRHFLDYYYGINLSRALTLAIKSIGSFKLMSSGRVQGPTLKILAEREKEIQKFKSDPFWTIEFKTKDFSAFHKEDKFWKKPTSIIKKIKGKSALVTSITKKDFLQDPLHPFDLTSLQLEAYNKLGSSPKDTLAKAQQLYTSGYISYPRTSSQKLPPSLNLKKIIKALANNSAYKKATDIILKTKLKPNEGKKTDPAHPAIFPTGNKPKQSSPLYDLIVRRFLATFGEKAKRQTQTINLEIEKEPFVAKGTITLEPGWHILYGRYARFKEETLPVLQKGDKIKGSVLLHEDKTKPPKRYNQASIIKELEKRDLGTKATRAYIVDALYQRYYVKDKAIEVTGLGMKTVSTLNKYCPEILDEELTRHFEKEMEKIREQKKKPETILKEAKAVLNKVLKKFKEKEKLIGKALLESSRETEKEINTVGLCSNCKKHDLILRRGRFGWFVACSGYPKCKTTFSVPKNALIRALKTECKQCKHPELLVIRKGKRPFKYCINTKCKLKESWGKDNSKKKKALRPKS